MFYSPEVFVDMDDVCIERERVCVCVCVCEDNNDVNVNVTLGRIMWVSVWVCHESVSVNDVFACVCVRVQGCWGFRVKDGKLQFKQRQ
jgi:hypothetical protein